MRKAFTVIEIIFVMVVMGIISAATFVSISGIYDEMVQKEATADMETGVKVAIEQVAARLSSSIKDSLVAMKIDGSCTNLQDANKDNEYALAWIGKSDEANMGLWDAVLGDYRPGWSGFVDVSVSGSSAISSKGSDLAGAQSIINSVTGRNDTLSTNPITAIYFHGSSANENACSELFGNYAASKIYKVKIGADNETFAKVDKDFANISEQYTMSHSAYALIRDTTDANNPKLMLYSFRPWLGEKPSDDKSPKIIASNVSNFGFKWDNGVFRINICESQTLNGFTAQVCKERAIF